MYRTLDGQSYKLLAHGQTHAMYLADNGLYIDPKWRHNPAMRDDYGRTVAMYFIIRGLKVPREWVHLPWIQDNKGDTAAVWCLMVYKRIPDIWVHDPTITNMNGRTVRQQAQILGLQDVLQPVWYMDAGQYQTTKYRQYEKDMIEIMRLRAKNKDVIKKNKDLQEVYSHKVPVIQEQKDMTKQYIDFYMGNFKNVQQQFQEALQYNNE